MSTPYPAVCRLSTRGTEAEGSHRIATASQSRRAGLTLIEVILATAILGIGLTTLVAATSRCLAVARKAQQYEVARRLIGQVDLEIPPNFEELEDSLENGQFERPYQDYTWEREILEFEDEELEMFSVRTAVYWNDRGTEAKEEVMTYVYGPTAVAKGVADARR